MSLYFVDSLWLLLHGSILFPIICWYISRLFSPLWLYVWVEALLCSEWLNVSSLASPQQWAQICGRLSRREGWFQLRLACDREQKCRRRWIKSTDAHVDVLWLHNDTTDCVSAQTALSLQAQINQTTLRPQSHAGRIQHLLIWQIQDHGTRLVTL